MLTSPHTHSFLLDGGGARAPAFRQLRPTVPCKPAVCQCTRSTSAIPDSCTGSVGSAATRDLQTSAAAVRPASGTSPPFAASSSTASASTPTTTGTGGAAARPSSLPAPLAAGTSPAPGVASTRAGVAAGLDPGPPPSFPPGPRGDAALQLLADPLAFLIGCQREWGDCCGLTLAGQRVALVADAVLAQQVLVEDAGSVFVKDGTAFFPGSSLAGNGLLVSDGETWRRQRQLSNPAFRKAAVERYSQAMVSATQGFTERSWRRGGTRDLYNDFNELTLQVVAEALFGSQLDAATATEVNEAIATAFEYFARRAATGFALPEWLPLPDNVRYNAAVKRLDTLVYRIIAQRRAMLAGAAPDQLPNDLLDSLLLSRDEAGRGMGDTALRDELMTLLVAGSETSAILLAWLAALLAHHPRAQAAAAEEVAAVLQGRPPAVADVRQLPALECCVLETLRLLPPAYMVGRCAARDVQLGPHHLPAGTTVLVSPYLLQRDGRHWDKPLAFRPGRWREHVAAGAALGGGLMPSMALMSGLGPNGAYLPFGAGPRNCIGTGFAMVEVMVVMAALLQAAELRPLEGDPFPSPAPLITLRPAAVRLALRPR